MKDELLALTGIASFTLYIGHAVKNYGAPQKIFEPAKKPIDWNQLIASAEKRILGGGDPFRKQTFTEKLDQLRGVSSFWNDTCARFLAKSEYPITSSPDETTHSYIKPPTNPPPDPISPATLTAFDTYINTATLQSTIRDLSLLSNFFANLPAEYSTLPAIITSHTLLFTLLATQEAYFIAAEGRPSNTDALSSAIQKGIQVLEAWPERYIAERARYVSIEEEYEDKHRFGHVHSQREMTGKVRLRDGGSDPVVGSLEGGKFKKGRVDVVGEVRERYWKGEMARVVLPGLVGEWKALRGLAVVSEAGGGGGSVQEQEQAPPAYSGQPGAGAGAGAKEGERRPDPKMWYRLMNVAFPGMSIDVINDGKDDKTDAQLEVVPEAYLSGQHWQFRPSKTTAQDGPPHWNLCTMFLGKGMCLDVYGDDERKPHLMVAGASSGQQWRLVDRKKDGAWSLWNTYSGVGMFLTARADSATPDALTLSVDVRKQVDDKKQMWFLKPIREITEEAFL